MQTYLRYGIVVSILEGEEWRLHDGTPEERRLGMSTVGDDVLQDGACTSRLSPNGNLVGVTAKRRNLYRVE